MSLLPIEHLVRVLRIVKSPPPHSAPSTAHPYPPSTPFTRHPHPAHSHRRCAYFGSSSRPSATRCSWASAALADSRSRPSQPPWPATTSSRLNCPRTTTARRGERTSRVCCALRGRRASRPSSCSPTCRWDQQKWDPPTVHTSSRFTSLRAYIFLHTSPIHTSVFTPLSYSHLPVHTSPCTPPHAHLPIHTFPFTPPHSHPHHSLLRIPTSSSFTPRYAHLFTLHTSTLTPPNRLPTLLFPQIKEEAYVEDLNNLLNAGEVPNLFAGDEFQLVAI